MCALPIGQQDTHHAPSPLIVNTGQIRESDSAEFELNSQPWELMIKPLDNNAFSHHKSYLVTPSFILYKSSYSSAIHLQGLTPEGMLGIGIPLKFGKRSLFWNSPINTHGIPATLPGGLDLVIDAGQTHMVILIEISLLERMLTNKQFTALKNGASRRQLPIIEHALGPFTQWLLKLLNHAQQQTDIFTQALVLQSIEEDFLQQLLNVVRLPSQTSTKEPRQKRRKGFEVALEFLREADFSSLSIPEICSKTGVSQRTLEYAFRENLSQTPVHFIKKLRFHAIRRKLLTADSSELTIANTAYQYGIYDMGRFASIYKKNFGELPSQTLLKPSVDSTNPFMTFK